MGLARARQQKAFHTGPSYGAVSRKISCFGVDHHRAADCKGGGAGGRVQGGCRVQGAGCRVGAGYRVQSGCGVQGAECVRGACGAGRAATVRDPATGVPSLFRRSASFVKKRNPQSAGPCTAVAVGHGARAVRWVRPLSRQGISTACPLGTDLGMSGSSSASKGGAGRGQGAGGAGRGRLFGARDGACCMCVRGGRRRAKAARSPAAVGAGWTEGPEERGRGCGAAPGERAEEGCGQRRGLRNLMWYWVPSSSRERRRDPGVRPCPSPTPPHPTAHRRVGVLASYKWV